MSGAFSRAVTERINAALRDAGGLGNAGNARDTSGCPPRVDAGLGSVRTAVHARRVVDEPRRHRPMADVR